MVPAGFREAAAVSQLSLSLVYFSQRLPEAQDAGVTQPFTHYTTSISRMPEFKNPKPLPQNKRPFRQELVLFIKYFIGPASFLHKDAKLNLTGKRCSVCNWWVNIG
jgi:hypothetical protein